ncbi:MAG: hypothetical protein ABQ298_11180 [Puniceicoccaceae bacterium]
MKTFFSKLIQYLSPEGEPTETELKELYRRMTEQEFRNILPEDLTPLGRKCYEAERMQRKRS